MCCCWDEQGYWIEDEDKRFCDGCGRCGPVGDDIYDDDWTDEE